jgi:uncharacterized membrane protein YoaK (UPF0700 family)
MCVADLRDNWSIGAGRRTIVQMLSDLMEALGLVLGSFAVAAASVITVWSAFGRSHHPEWSAPALLIALSLAIAMRLVRGELLSMAAILLTIAAPFMWMEGRRRKHGSKAPAGPGTRRGPFNGRT